MKLFGKVRAMSRSRKCINDLIIDIESPLCERRPKADMNEIRNIITSYVTNRHFSADKMVKILRDEFGEHVTKKTVLRIYKELGDLRQKRSVYHKQQLGTSATNMYDTIAKRDSTENSYSIDLETGEYNGINTKNIMHKTNRQDATDLELLYWEYASGKNSFDRIENIKEILYELNKMNIDEKIKEREVKLWNKRLLNEWEIFFSTAEN